MDNDSKCIPSFISSPFKLCKKMNGIVGIGPVLIINPQLESSKLCLNQAGTGYKVNIETVESYTVEKNISMMTYNPSVSNMVLKDVFTIKSFEDSNDKTI